MQIEAKPSGGICEQPISAFGQSRYGNNRFIRRRRMKHVNDYRKRVCQTPHYLAARRD